LNSVLYISKSGGMHNPRVEIFLHMHTGSGAYMHVEPPHTPSRDTHTHR